MWYTGIGDDLKLMADTSTTSASFIVRQTKREYQEMRKKLAETECKLNQLAKIEAKSQPITAYRYFVFCLFGW